MLFWKQIPFLKSLKHNEKNFIKDKKYTIEEVFEAISKKPIIQLDEKVKYYFRI